ncbi:MAG: hypothetical protein KGN74_05530 [Gemmatimonadota bacterium]|nr:hypothetical protein [Gemmatimonadota bacterium]
MRTLMVWALAGALAAAAAPAPVAAQTLQQVVDTRKAQVSKKIDGAKLPDDVKAAFRTRFAKLSSLELESQRRELDRIEVDVANNEGAYAEWQKGDAYIRAQTDLPQKVRDYYTGLMQDALTKMLPANSGQLWSQVASYKTYVDNNKRLVAAIRDNIKTVSDDKVAPAILQQQTLKRLQAMIDILGTPGVSSSFNGLNDEMTDFRNQMITVTELDKLSQRVKTESPPGSTWFIIGTQAKISEMRKDVGNPKANTSLDAVRDFQRRYEDRLSLLKICADIRAKIPKLPAEDQPSYTRQLDALAEVVVNWNAGQAPDRGRIQTLYNNIVERVGR